MIDPLRTTLRTLGVGRAWLRARELRRLLTDPGYLRRQWEEMSEYLEWRQRHRATLRPPLYPAGSRKRVLIVTKGTLNGTQVELALIKGLELGGFVPVVLNDRPELEKHYRLAGVESVRAAGTCARFRNRWRRRRRLSTARARSRTCCRSSTPARGSASSRCQRPFARCGSADSTCRSR